MFGIFKKKDPLEKLQKAYLKKMEEARNVLRSGDVKNNARLVAEAEEIAIEIEKLRSKYN
jgi:hypothetical protein